MQTLKKLPSHIGVAVSGGVDSVVLLHFLIKTGRHVTAVHYVHDSEYAETEYQFVSKLCQRWSVPLTIGHQTPGDQTGGQEAYWRRGRYEFFDSLDGLTVCTGHTLDDAVEWYLFSSLRGQGHFMNYQRASVVRPWICTNKQEIVDYATANGIEWLEDPSNACVKFATRNRIRHELIPVALQVNPGLYNTVRRRIRERTFNQTEAI